MKIIKVYVYAIFLLFAFSECKSRGSFYFYSTKWCVVRDCALNSVDSVYGIVTFPSRIHSNEFDKVSFDIRDDEYLDIHMKTPPKCFYYSWGLYLMDRWFNYKDVQYGASINDTLNCFFIKHQMQSTEIYNTDIRVFVSRNNFILDELKSRYDAKNVFYMSWNEFPNAVPKFNASGDRLSMYFRVMMPDNVTEFNKYIQTPPVTVYREKYTLNHIHHFYSPEGIWKKRSEYGISEQFLKYELEYISNIVSLKLARWIKSDYIEPLVSRIHRASVNYDNGYDCIINNLSCFIDNRDTIYIGNGYECKGDTCGYYLKNETLGFIMGVNHTFFQNSLYTSLQLYNYDKEQGFFSFHSFEKNYERSKSFANSCNVLFSFLDVQFDYPNEQFYCLLFSRQPLEYWRLSERLHPFYKQILESDVQFKDRFNTVERVYLQNEASISSVYGNVLLPHGFLIHL